jgi:hypothetical protein
MTQTEPGAAMLEQLAALGPFFAVDTHDAHEPARPPWRPLRAVVGEPAVLRERVASVRGYLAAAGGQPLEMVPLRVAASVTHLGLAARLVSPVLALAVLHGVLLPLDLGRVRWQAVLGGAFPLSLARKDLIAGGPPLLAPWGARLLDGPVRELVEAVGRLSVSPRVLWGNVASAVNGAATALAAAAPAQAERAREIAALLLKQPPLQGTSTRTSGGAQFRRRSCCLIYQAAPRAAGKVCGDCVLQSR